MIKFILSVVLSLSLFACSHTNNLFKLQDNNPKHNIQLVKYYAQLYEDELPQHLIDLMVVQAVLESRLGEKPSRLALDNSNLFGVKCPLDKPGSYFNTKEVIKKKVITVKAYFCRYSSLSEGFSDRIRIYKLKRYEKVWYSSNYNQAAEELYKGGYATDPSYAKKLIKMHDELYGNP